jgi:Plavaka transposase
VLADHEYKDDPAFRTFCQQLFHSSLGAIFEPLCNGMTVPEVTLCADGHYRCEFEICFNGRKTTLPNLKFEVVHYPTDNSGASHRLAIYGLGPYIADYPEQVLLANIVQDWCPRYVLFYGVNLTLTQAKDVQQNQTIWMVWLAPIHEDSQRLSLKNMD